MAEGKKMKGAYGPFDFPVFISSNLRLLKLIENKLKACKNKNGCRVCDDCEGNLECEKCVICKKCRAAIKREKDSLDRTERNFKKWDSLWQKIKTAEPFWKFNEPKKRKPRKSKEERTWDEIVKADGRPFREREDYDSDEEFRKERELAEDKLHSNDNLYEEESCRWCQPGAPNPNNRCECPQNKGMRKVRLELHNWRELAVARRLAKIKTEEETRKREKLELIRWLHQRTRSGTRRVRRVRRVVMRSFGVRSRIRRVAMRVRR